MFGNYTKKLNKLCKPSQFYLFLSLFSLVIIFIQNMNEPHKYCVGNYDCNLEYSNIFVFAVKLAFIFMWTIIFDSLCKNGYTNLAWGIVLVPFVMMFLMIAMFMMSKNSV